MTDNTKHPAELVERVAAAIHRKALSADMVGYAPTSVEYAIAALDALDLTVTERWQAEWRGRMGVSACATDSRENATVLAGKGGTVRRRTELRAETPWEVVTDE